MFIVSIVNNGVETEIHGEHERLISGKVVKGINAIDSFTFTILPYNPGFDLLHDFITLVKVYNTNRKRYEFFGRVLYSDTTMAETGLITKQVTCESYFGFLCDSQQSYVATQNWTVKGLLQNIINKHNSMVEDYKKFTIGEVTVTDPNDNLYCGIQYANTWDTIKEKLLDVLGGEIRFRVVDGKIYLDYLTEIGKVSETEIAVTRNMKSIKQEKDPSSYITRLIPLGMKVGESDQRLEITEVNNGKNYIDDEAAIALYGIHVGYVEWDDVTDDTNLLNKGKAWLKANNKLLIKYSITALDLSLLGLDIDDFDVGNYHPIINHLIDVDDVARIVKKNIDICEEVKSTIEVGDNLKTLSDIQISQAQEAAKIYSQIIKSNEEIQLKVTDEVQKAESVISQKVDNLSLGVSSANGSTTFTLSSNGVQIDTDTVDLHVKAANVSGKLTANQIETKELKVDAANVTGTLQIGQLPDTVAETSDIPTKVSELSNDENFVNESGVTSIVEGVVTTDYVNALGVYASELESNGPGAYVHIKNGNIDLNGIGGLHAIGAAGIALSANGAIYMGNPGNTGSLIVYVDGVAWTLDSSGWQKV